MVALFGVATLRGEAHAKGSSSNGSISSELRLRVRRRSRSRAVGVVRRRRVSRRFGAASRLSVRPFVR